MVTVFRAFINSEKSSPSAVISAFPARPFAITATISLVEVSPSTLTILKVFFTSVESARPSISGLMAQSVVMNTSMVAILGWIIPEPLAIPPMRHTLPPTVNSTATVFSLVSVVIMPSAASWEPSVLMDFTRVGMPSLKGVMLMG